MADTSGVTLFVPCFNEDKNILNTLTTIKVAFEHLKIDYEIIAIDDASTDKTVTLIEDYIKANPVIRITLHVQPKNKGLAYNFTEAAFLGSKKYFRQVNGDNDETVDTLITIFRHLGKADIIIPFHQNALARSMPRRILSKTYTNLINFLNGYNVKYYNGLSIYLREHVMRWHSRSHGFGYQAELITDLLDTGSSYMEVPIVASKRVHGQSKAITLTNFLSIIHSLIKIVLRRTSKIYYRRRRKELRSSTDL